MIIWTVMRKLSKKQQRSPALGHNKLCCKDTNPKTL
jgi:hypothetical protein